MSRSTTTSRHRDSKGRPLVAVTGLGIVTSLGQGKDANWEALTAGKSGIHRIERFPTEGLRTTIGGTVDFLFDGPFTAPQLSEKLATLAAEEAVGQSGIGQARRFPGRTLHGGVPHHIGPGAGSPHSVVSPPSGALVVVQPAASSERIPLAQRHLVGCTEPADPQRTASFLRRKNNSYVLPLWPADAR